MILVLVWCASKTWQGMRRRGANAYSEIHFHEAVEHELDEGEEDGGLIQRAIIDIVGVQARSEVQGARHEGHKDELHKTEDIQEGIALDEDHLSPHQRRKELLAGERVSLLDQHLPTHQLLS